MENKVKFNAGGSGVKIQFCPKSKMVKKIGGVQEEMNVISTNRAIFRAGDGSQSAKKSAKLAKKAELQSMATYVSPQNLSRGDLAWKISADIALLSESYTAVSGMNSEHSESFLNMKSELVIVSSSMKKIAQSLMRAPRQGQSAPPVRFSTFCNGLSEIVTLQRKIMTDLRHLQRMAESFSTQIVIIYLTIQAQNETTQKILESEC